MTVLDGKRVYLDSNIFIYAAEGLPESVESVRRLFTQIAAESIPAVTSELTLAEVLVKPLQENRADVVAAYEQTIKTSSTLEVFPISREIIIHAAEYRARTGVRLPDAIHIATALLVRSEVFVTADKRLRSIAGLTVVHLSDLVA